MPLAVAQCRAGRQRRSAAALAIIMMLGALADTKAPAASMGSRAQGPFLPVATRIPAPLSCRACSDMHASDTLARIGITL
jgi:hypothetical protein